MKRKLGIIIAGVTAIAFSAIASVAGTVAWFTANNIVTVSNMNIQAEVEEGIVVSNEDQSAWAASATAKYNAAVSVVPTSTAEGTTWYRNNSDSATIATGSGHVGAYLSYTGNEITRDSSTGAGKVDLDKAGEGTVVKNIYLLNKFYLKSSTGEAVTKKLNVKSLTLSGVTTDLDKALRVLVVSGSNQVLFASASDSTLSYGVNGATTGVTALLPTAVNSQLIASASIPAYTATDGLEIDVYLYFEGEDAHCTSANATATLSSLGVSLQFETVDIA